MTISTERLADALLRDLREAPFAIGDEQAGDLAELLKLREEIACGAQGRYSQACNRLNEMALLADTMFTHVTPTHVLVQSEETIYWGVTEEQEPIYRYEAVWTGACWVEKETVIR